MQSTKRLVRILAPALALLLASTPHTWGAGNTPGIAPDATTHHFGKVPRGTVVTRTFTLRNPGTTPVQIEGMQFSVPGMRARVAPTIEPGTSAELKVEWDTKGYAREAEGHVLLKLTDPHRPKLVLTLSGFVVAPVDIEPVPAFYLSQFRGESSTQTVTIRNNRDRAMQISGTGQEGKSVSIAVKAIEPGRVFAVTATAARNLAPGTYTESVLVFTDDPERSKIRLDVNLLVKRDVHASVDALDIGRVRIASLRANASLLDLLRQTVILESRSARMRITGIESDLPFLTLHHEPRGRAKRARVDVGLDPARLFSGTHKGSIRIRTNVPGASLMILPVSLTVVD